MDDLVSMAARGDVEKLREHLTEPGHTEDRAMALVVAVDYGQLPSVEELIKAGTDVNQQVTQPPLMCAVESKDVACFDLLVNSGADVTIRSLTGQTPLMVAADSGSSDCLKRLLRFPQVDINARNLFGETALHKAAFRGDSECLRILLETERIEINFQDLNGDTPLTLSAQRDYFDCVEMLLKHPDIDIELVNNDGQTALFVSVDNASEESMELLLKVPGVNIDVVDNKGCSLVDTACNLNNKTMVQRLFQAGVDVKDNLALDRTPLMCLAAIGNTEFVRTLIGRGFSILRRDYQDKNALYFAAANGQVECLKILIQALSDHDKSHVGMKKIFLRSARMRRIYQSLDTFFEEKIFRWSWYPEFFRPGFRSLVQQMVVSGLPPGKFEYEGTVMSPLQHSFVINDLGLARFIMANLYLGPHDLRHFQRDTFVESCVNNGRNISARAVFQNVFRQPWRLETLSFLTISTSLPTDRRRRSVIASSSLPRLLPRKFLIRLSLRSRIKWLPPPEWDGLQVNSLNVGEPGWSIPRHLRRRKLSNDLVYDSPYAEGLFVDRDQILDDSDVLLDSSYSEHSTPPHVPSHSSSSTDYTDDDDSSQADSTESSNENKAATSNLRDGRSSVSSQSDDLVSELYYSTCSSPSEKSIAEEYYSLDECSDADKNIRETDNSYHSSEGTNEQTTEAMCSRAETLEPGDLVYATNHFPGESSGSIDLVPEMHHPFEKSPESNELLLEMNYFLSDSPESTEFVPEINPSPRESFESIKLVTETNESVSDTNYSPSASIELVPQAYCSPSESQESNELFLQMNYPPSELPESYGLFLQTDPPLNESPEPNELFLQTNPFSELPESNELLLQTNPLSEFPESNELFLRPNPFSESPEPNELFPQTNPPLSESLEPNEPFPQTNFHLSESLEPNELFPQTNSSCSESPEPNEISP